MRERRDRHEQRDDERHAGNDDRAQVAVGPAAQGLPDRNRERAEERSRERGVEDCGHVLDSSRGRPVDAHGADHRRSHGATARVRRALIGGCALGFATGWNISNTGAIATQLSHRYGVGLATIGLFTTALFTTHLVAGPKATEPKPEPV